MIQIRVESREHLARAMVDLGRKLEVGRASMLAFDGQRSGVAIVARADRNTLQCSGELWAAGPKPIRFKAQVALWGGGNVEFPGAKIQDPEAILTRSGEGRTAGVSDLYEGGGRFPPDACPRIREGCAPSSEGAKLARRADKALRTFLATLPEADRQGLREPKPRHEG